MTDDPELAETEHAIAMEKVAMSVAPWAEKAIRRDERRKLANLLESHGEAITKYTSDDSQTLKLIVYMLRLEDGVIE